MYTEAHIGLSSFVETAELILTHQKQGRAAYYVWFRKILLRCDGAGFVHLDNKNARHLCQHRLEQLGVGCAEIFIGGRVISIVKSWNRANVLDCASPPLDPTLNFMRDGLGVPLQTARPGQSGDMQA